MRFKPLFNIIGALLTILGLSMVVPILISFFYNEYDLNGFLYSSMFCILLGFPMWYFTRYKRSLTNRDGFAIVTFSWITTALLVHYRSIFLDLYQILQMRFLNLCQELPLLEPQF